MKNLSTALKIIGAVVAVAAIIFVVVRYGETIVSWMKKMLGKMGVASFQEATLFDTDDEEAEVVLAADQDFAG